MKTFKNNRGRGFHITFPNGVMLSTQFGWGNYCENYNSDLTPTEEMKKTDWESDDAEIAIIAPEGWITKKFKDKGDDVLGHVQIKEWLKAFDWARRYRPRKPKRAVQQGGVK